MNIYFLCLNYCVIKDESNIAWSSKVKGSYDGEITYVYHILST